MKLFSFFLLGALAIAGCAAEDTDNTNTGETEAASTVASCQPDASFVAHANRVCTAEGKTASLGTANRTYADHGTAKQCPGGEAVSIPFSCR